MRLCHAALAALSLASAMAGPGFAQSSGSGSAMQGMPGMKVGSGSASGMSMGGGNMAAMMKDCAAMQSRMKPGTPMTSDMQRMMTQCSRMNSQMGNAKAPAPSSTLDR